MPKLLYCNNIFLTVRMKKPVCRLRNSAPAFLALLLAGLRFCNTIYCTYTVCYSICGVYDWSGLSWHAFSDIVLLADPMTSGQESWNVSQVNQTDKIDWTDCTHVLVSQWLKISPAVLWQNTSLSPRFEERDDGESLEVHNLVPHSLFNGRHRKNRMEWFLKFEMGCRHVATNWF